MTIDEAIKQLEESDWFTTVNHTPEYSKAIQLAIEALKRLQDLRVDFELLASELLPGETEK